MSIVHRLAIGHLLPDAVAHRRLAVTAPFPEGARSLLEGRVDATWRLGGYDVVLSEGYVESVWLGIDGPNVALIEFALDAIQGWGLIAADVRHARVIGVEELASGLRAGGR
jgi:hypothetical protein